MQDLPLYKSDDQRFYTTLTERVKLVHDMEFSGIGEAVKSHYRFLK